MKKSVVSTLLILAIIGSALAITYGAFAIRAGRPGAEAVVEQPPPNVATRLVYASRVENMLQLSGKIDAWEKVTLSAEAAGKIERQGIEEGDAVEQGVEVIRINTTAIRATIDESKARLKLADQELKRVTRLGEEGISSPQDLDKARSDRDVQSANLRLNEIKLAQSIIEAPIGGVVDKLYMEAGEFAGVGANLVRIIQVDKVKAIVGLPEREVALFALGDSVAVTVDAYPDRVFTGKIFRVATSAEESTRTFATEIELDNGEGLLRPGMITRTGFVRATYPEAITIPMFSVLSRGLERYVFVESEGVAERRPVTVGFYKGNVVHVTSGLGDQDRLIVVGHRQLRDGQRVTVQSHDE